MNLPASALTAVLRELSLQEPGAVQHPRTLTGLLSEARGAFTLPASSKGDISLEGRMGSKSATVGWEMTRGEELSTHKRQLSNEWKVTCQNGYLDQDLQISEEAP